MLTRVVTCVLVGLAAVTCNAVPDLVEVPVQTVTSKELVTPTTKESTSEKPVLEMPIQRMVENDSNLKTENDPVSEAEPSKRLKEPTAERLTAVPLDSRLQQSQPVECYVCADCPTVDESTPRKMCPNSNHGDKSGKCVVYTEKYKNMDRLWYIRGCPQERGSCQEVEHAHSTNNEIVTLNHCKECKGSLCNTAFAEKPLVMMMAALIGIPLMLKFLMK